MSLHTAAHGGQTQLADFMIIRIRVEADVAAMLAIVNQAARAYRGVEESP